MRDLIVLAIVFATLPVIVFRPYFGLLTYSWLAYMRPQDMTFGMSRWLPLSQWVALAMLVGILVTLGRERLITIKLQTVLLFLLILWISLTVMTAVLPEMSKEVYGHYWKGIAIALLTTGLVRDKERFRLLYLLIPFSIGFLGAKRGLVGLMRGGIQYNDGPGGLMSDNNSFALMLNMMLPLLVGIAVTDERKWVRVTAAVMAALCVPTIFFTFSRGGLVTLCVVSALLLWRSKHRFLVAGLMAFALLGFLAFTSDAVTDKYLDRASTIDDYEEDGSAQGRLNAWKTSWYVFLDYPLVGVGPNNLATVFRRYSPEVDRFRVAHNAYFQILAESGFPALLLFLAAIGAALWRMEVVRKATVLPWVEVQARMLQVAIVAYMTGSMFLNTAYNELIYHLLALTVCLEVVASQTAEVREEEIPWWKRPPAPAAATGMGSV
ncbi:MAG TPA: putative O-glycosylation ligase, exosortase A system-associated [Thermoanaerobaculia bacterium]|nr:putative O-glycosylation ligase, exosortase A system-associated [Thermoanaerobaculia bacterium]